MQGPQGLTDWEFERVVWNHIRNIQEPSPVTGPQQERIGMLHSQVILVQIPCWERTCPSRSYCHVGEACNQGTVVPPGRAPEPTLLDLSNCHRTSYKDSSRLATLVDFPKKQFRYGFLAVRNSGCLQESPFTFVCTDLMEKSVDSSILETDD